MTQDPDKLYLWTVYFNPADFPGEYVARCWALDQPTDFIIRASTLEALRSMLPAGLYRMDRTPGDNPVIVETWF